MVEDSAFTVGTLGFFQCKCMPFRLCSAPAMFQHLMQSSLGELNLVTWLMYLDDVVIFSVMQEEHLDRLQAILEQFREHGLELKPSKCSFFCQEIEWNIAKQVQPKSHSRIQAFLGMAGHYRHFIKNYARICLTAN